jgi:hypothetical protein
MNCEHSKQIPDSLLDCIPDNTNKSDYCPVCCYQLGIQEGMLKAARKILKDIDFSELKEEALLIPEHTPLEKRMMLEKQIDALVAKSKMGDHNSAIVFAFELGRQYK